MPARLLNYRPISERCSGQLLKLFILIHNGTVFTRICRCLFTVVNQYFIDVIVVMGI